MNLAVFLVKGQVYAKSRIQVASRDSRKTSRCGVRVASSAFYLTQEHAATGIEQKSEALLKAAKIRQDSPILGTG
jgi:hypothetical protein